MFYSCLALSCSVSTFFYHIGNPLLMTLPDSSWFFCIFDVFFMILSTVISFFDLFQCGIFLSFWFFWLILSPSLFLFLFFLAPVSLHFFVFLFLSLLLFMHCSFLPLFFSFSLSFSVFLSFVMSSCLSSFIVFSHTVLIVALDALDHVAFVELSCDHSSGVTCNSLENIISFYWYGFWSLTVKCPLLFFVTGEISFLVSIAFEVPGEPDILWKSYIVAMFFPVDIVVQWI